jgi:hypothetical protein
MRDLIEAVPGYSARDEGSRNSGYLPFSNEEFNDIVAQVYVSFVTNNDPTQKAIVYHTTQSNRNRYLGEYYVFEYNGSEMVSVPDPTGARLPRREQAQDKNGRTFPDVFWSILCNASPPASLMGVGRVVPFTIAVRAVLVGSLLLKFDPNILGRQKAISKDTIKEIYAMQITENHTIQDLCPDFAKFSTFVKNCADGCLQFRSHPYQQPNFTSEKRQQHLGKVALCRNFQLEGSNRSVLGEGLEDSISVAIRHGKLLQFLELGLRGMNNEYVEFLLRLQHLYEVTVSVAWDTEKIKLPLTSSYRREAQKVAEAWREGDNVLELL